MRTRKLLVVVLGFAIFSVFVGIGSMNGVFAQTSDQDYQQIRMKIFHLLNLVPGEPAKPPVPLATPTPAIQRAQIIYKGNVVGNAEYSLAGGYQISVDIPEQFNTNFDYYAFLRRPTPASTVRLADKLPGFRFQARDTRNLIDYTELLISEEQPGTAPPNQPSNVKFQAEQQRITPTPGAGQPQSTPSQQSTPTSAQPTQAQNPTQPQGPTQGQNPTQGPSQGPTVQEQMQSVVAKISEAKIIEYLQNLANEEGKTDETQTRYSGTQGNIEEQNYIIQHFQNLGYEVDTSQEFTFLHEGTQITTKNIIARIPGRNVSSYYLVVAHMDSTAETNSGTIDPAPGVNDNGSGTAVVMELARVFKEANIQPEHSIEFVLFSGEEQRLDGSKEYVRRLPSSKTIRAVINLDMVGNIDPRGSCVNFFFNPGTGGNLISDVIVQTASDFNLGLGGSSTGWNMRRSDHASFWNAGINTAIFGHECNSGADGGVYHSVNDKLDKVSTPQISKAAQAVGGALVKMVQEGIGQQLTNTLHTNIRGVNVLGVETDSYTLASVPFKEIAELDFLFQNTSIPVEYLYGYDVPEPLFLGLFTNDQLKALETNGYSYNALDTEVANMDNYVLLYNHVPNKGDVLNVLGAVTTLAPNYFLVKLDPGKEYTHEGELGKFFEMDLPENPSPPPFDTEKITLAPTQQPADAPGNGTQGENNGSRLGFVALVVVILSIIGLSGFFILRTKKNGRDAPMTDGGSETD